MLRGSAGIAVAMAVMNVATYAFQMISARLLGPTEYGAVASLMALLMVVAVLQLGLQATGARRISAEPEHVGQIERMVLRVTYRSALALGLLMLVLAPLVHQVLRLDSVVPALLLAVSAVPLTVMGGQAGVLQGERRWFSLAGIYLAMGLARVVVGTACIAVSPTETAAMLGVTVAMFAPALVGWVALRRPGTHVRDSLRHSDQHTGRRVVTETGSASLALLAFFVLSNLFVGGAEYADVESRLWVFAILGTLLAMLQLLVYSVLARRGTKTTYLVWLAVLTLVVLSTAVDALGSLAAVVVCVDAALFVALLGISLWRLKEPVPAPPQA